jgi:hypothetical protein
MSTFKKYLKIIHESNYEDDSNSVRNSILRKLKKTQVVKAVKDNIDDKYEKLVDVKKTVDNVNKKNTITTDLEAKELGDEINNDLDELNKMIDEDYETYFLEVLNDKKIYEKTEIGKKFHSDMVNLLSKIIREISNQFNNPQVVYYKKELEGFTIKSFKFRPEIFDIALSHALSKFKDKYHSDMIINIYKYKEYVKKEQMHKLQDNIYFYNGLSKFFKTGILKNKDRSDVYMSCTKSCKEFLKEKEIIIQSTITFLN